MPESDETLLKKVNAVLAPFGCVATELGPNSVGVQGDNRVVGPSIYVQFPPDTPHDQIALISNKITNEVPGITRVLMDITPAKTQL